MIFVEQHAVPQDITGFKFRLVGDMTLKQFGELAFGAIMAYLFYASSWHPLLKWPLATLFGFLGIALAFLPIEERPLDVWIINFFRAIYRPTLYVWEKDASAAAYLSGPSITRVKLPGQTPQPQPQPSPEPPSIKAEEPRLEPWPYEKEQRPSLSVEELQKMREQKQAELEEAKKKLTETTKLAKQEVYRSQVAPSVVTVEELTKMREQKLAQKDQEVKSAEPAEPTPGIKVIDRPTEKQATISLSNQPNVISGMIVNDKGAPIDGVIVLIKDKTGNSIRALKTNMVGQFVVATPLENGTYYVEMEKPGYNFKVLEITLSGNVTPPLEILTNTLERGQYGDNKDSNQG